ncbi:MAG: hypothetical protein A2010_02160 [Nitrospirae bacterium GWD2_57_9]|nr:MAG: hypothetical protein A2010_02160 [Nitrospirae bacterium GWD2_57_9]OGW47880.1 MAG: hypothetical protein A2078_00230 [Nitrospirae bacterium GWC2_57_9]
MDELSDGDLLEELNRRFQDNKKALHDMVIMNEKIEKLNQKLVESERVKTSFLSNIRNEINNPLTAILGMARQLADPVKDEKTRQLMARMIYTEAFELDFQLRNIFVAAELEAGETGLNTARVDLAPLVRSVIGSFEHKAREKSVTVLFRAADGENEQVFTTDPEKLRIVLANLLANAIEFNPPGKHVTIEARIDGTSLQVSIADQGAGIPGQERTRLFERFRQLDQGSSKKHKGHGLGLSITKALVDMLGGKITVADAPGGGALFQVVIPEAAGAGSDVFSGDGNEFLFESGSTF